MKSDPENQGTCLRIDQKPGGFIEMFFDWDRVPVIDLSVNYYLVEIIPDSDLLPKEYARPNSAGPLHFRWAEDVSYQVNLLCVSHLRYQVESKFNPDMLVEMVPQHENLQKLIWKNLSSDGFAESYKDKKIQIIADDQLQQIELPLHEISCEIVGRPKFIRGQLPDGSTLFEIRTNYHQYETAESLTIRVEKSSTWLSFSTVVDPLCAWKVRAELNASFRIRELWQRHFLEKYASADISNLTAFFRYFENDKVVSEVRQYGFSTRVKSGIIDYIQLTEWKQEKKKEIKEFKLQLQISSAHRELYRFVLKEKTYSPESESSVMGFTGPEIEECEAELFSFNRHVSWDESFLELVLLFRVDGSPWCEFQRDNAQNLKWDFIPGKTCEFCRCEWVLQDLQNLENNIVLFRSGEVNRIHWPNKLVLKPFSATHLVAWWDISQAETEELVRSTWKTTQDSVGYYLKIHEEYLGNRIRRGDLDLQIHELFSPHQNLYFEVEPDKCFSAEIVARHYQHEIALTPVSKSIVTPRLITSQIDFRCYRSLAHRWFHYSQREVRHQQGRDSSNHAKVLIHLHFHSPNLFRVDPFRESYLKDKTWPVQTVHGDEVHNPPGEWVTKNCMDSWLPLLRVFRNLVADGIDYQVSLNISPPVAYTLSSNRFKDYMSRYMLRVQSFIQSRISIIKARKDHPQYIRAAERYLEEIRALDLFYNHEIGKDIIKAFKDLEAKGYLEISSCTATHGMPGELESMPDSLKAQIVLAARSHHRIFGEHPHGIWLAENSYFPGVEQFLENEHLNYFFVESEAVLNGSYKPREEEFNPVMINGSSVVAFPRSRLGRTQVWDAKIGYAGHPDFREYHFRHMGLPLKKITTKDSNEKLPYDPDNAGQTAKNLARDFYRKLREQAFTLKHKKFRTIPLVTCSYDAELFGHHWYEGPLFMEELLREFFYNSDAIGLTTPSHYLADSADLPELVPNPSTWGHDALHVRWSDPKVIWIYKELERAEGILNQYLALALEGKLNELEKQMVEQMAAELIRAQNSDLPFVIISGDFEEDMQREIQKFLNYFYKFKYLIDNNIQNSEFLEFRQYENDMFPEIPGFYNIR
ncbi:DUF1957 domain-containing protein [bacterium]|nr:DUF1957 domain-containing protein [bacterium]